MLKDIITIHCWTRSNKNNTLINEGKGTMADRIPVIYDCDNTMGVPGCDIDDGLTLLFLLGCEDAELLGITCAYGNNSQDTVYSNTLRLLREWGRSDVPVIRGAADPGLRRAYMETGGVQDQKVLRRSEASAFLACKAREYSGSLCIVATGAMTNLAGAEEDDPGFFGNVKTISCMGGITEELFVGGIHMDELNLSCDPYASLRVISKGKEVRIATAQNSLQSYFGRDEFNDYLDSHEGPVADMLRRETSYWFDLYEKEWNCRGFVNWDVMAAMQLLSPDSLDLRKTVIAPDIRSLSSGSLNGNGEPVEVFLPEIADHDLYFSTVYDNFFRANISSF